MQQCLPLSALFLMLILVVFTTFIVAIFYRLTAITFLQFDVINFCGTAVCTTYGIRISSYMP
jgi:hypothetical protein